MGTRGKCCDAAYDNIKDPECDMGGYTSWNLEKEDKRAFLCPGSAKCGPEKILTAERSRTYSIDTTTLTKDQLMCKHQISFPISAGMGDVLFLTFKNFQQGTQVFFTTGPSWPKTGPGMYLEDLELSTVKVAWPNSMYLIIYHADVSRTADFGSNIVLKEEDRNLFSFDFYYEPAQFAGLADGFEVEI